MKTTRTVLIAACIAGLVIGAVLCVARRNQSRLESGLPPRTVRETVGACYGEAMAYAQAHGGRVIAIAGTGSEAPYIPQGKGATFEDRKKEIVAYAVMDPDKEFARVTRGALVLYFPAWNSGQPVLHQAALFDHGGWIMTGLHNSASESSERMTPEKFGGVVAFVAVLKP